MFAASRPARSRWKGRSAGCWRRCCFYLHTSFVLGILRSRETPWISPSRNPGETLPLRTAMQMFWRPGIGVLGLTALAWRLVPSFLVYLQAVVVGWGPVAREPG